MTQAEAYEIMKSGQNIFLTGPAGSGKTFLLNRYIAYLKKNKIKVAVTASTGIAATHLNGRTIHSWCGMGIAETMTDAQLKNFREKDQVTARILSARTLIIDEISMISANRLDLVDTICKTVRQSLRPFGGLQVILSGDFFQLPPVARNGEDCRFVVDSLAWQEADIKACYLCEQYRQADENFLRILNDIRGNAVTSETKDILSERLNRKIKASFEPTKLHTHNLDVDAHNNRELDKLSGDGLVFEMYTEGNPYLVKSLKESYCLAPERLRLKIGAVVMFVRNNFNKGYVNGTLGQVVDFDEDSGRPVVETTDGDYIVAHPESWSIDEGYKTIASVTQVPLRLAWAITVHKSQGMSLDCAEIDLTKTFEFGMGYVALSRVRSLSGINLIGLNDMALRVNPQVFEFDKALRLKSLQDLKEFKSLSKKEVTKKQKAFLKNNSKGGSADSWDKGTLF